MIYRNLKTSIYLIKEKKTKADVAREHGLELAKKLLWHKIMMMLIF
jgi:hypothetical protein